VICWNPNIASIAARTVRVRDAGERSPRREPAPRTFNCPDCGTVVHSWSGIDRYTDWRLLQRAYSELTAPIEAPAVAALFNDPARSGFAVAPVAPS